MYKSKYKKASSRIAKRSRNQKIFNLFFKVSIPVALVVGLVFLFRANFLQVKNFAILGTQSIQEEEIKNSIKNFLSGNTLFFIPKTDIFFVNKKELASALMAQFSRIESIDINKQFFSEGLQFTVKERTADFLWCPQNDPLSQAECFFMDRSGLIFEKAEISESNFLLSSQNHQEIVNKIVFKSDITGDPLLKNFTYTEQMKNYLSLIDYLKNEGVETVAFILEDENKIKLKTNFGDILFSPQEKDFLPSVQNVVLLINDLKSKNSFVHFNYIDARFGTKLYYKLAN